jgi:hypothetical protein
MTKLTDTKFAHVDGRTIGVGDTVISTNLCPADGRIRLYYALVDGFERNDSNDLCVRVQYYDARELPLGESFEALHLGGLASTDAGLTETIVIAKRRYRGEPIETTPDGTLRQRTFVIGSHRSAAAIAQNSLLGGPTGPGKGTEPGWSPAEFVPMSAPPLP